MMLEKLYSIYEVGDWVKKYNMGRLHDAKKNDIYIRSSIHSCILTFSRAPFFFFLFR